MCSSNVICRTFILDCVGDEDFPFNTNDHAISPFYNQKYMKIEQVALKYLYFA